MDARRITSSTDGRACGWLTRLRWRRRGAWLWPAFVVADGRRRGDRARCSHRRATSQTLAGGGAARLRAQPDRGRCCCSRPLGALLRRFRRDLPGGRRRATTPARARCSRSRRALLAAGLAHRSTIVAHQRACCSDAIARAQAFIGDRAPAEFRRNLSVRRHVHDPGRPRLPHLRARAATRPQTYCVIVKAEPPVRAQRQASPATSRTRCSRRDG